MTDTLTPASLRAGSRVGPWRVERYAGHGSYGVVYRASLAELEGGPPVALKVAQYPDDPRFAREAGLLSRAHHPSIPRLLDQGVLSAEGLAGRYPYVVMQWSDGVTLYEWGQQVRPSSRQVLRVLGQVAGALAALHKVGGLHRDVKGHNVLVDGEEELLLTDFGSGTWVGAPPLTDRVLAPGTPDYRSPEALRFQWKHWKEKKARYEARAADDLYAFGVTAWRLVTGIYPPPLVPEEFQEDEPSTPAPESPDELVTVCPELAAVICQLLSEDPAARGSAAQVAEAIEHAVRKAGSEADQPITQLPVSAPPVRRSKPGAVSTAWTWRRWCATAAGVAATVGLVTLLVVHGGREERQPPREERVRPERDEDREDAGTSLAQEARMVSARLEKAEPVREGMAAKLPKKPLPNQAKPPCKKWKEAINGGCWGRQEVTTPPCREGDYEWQGACYYPVLSTAPDATSEPK
jgi:serine/threonine protein kinase